LYNVKRDYGGQWEDQVQSSEPEGVEELVLEESHSVKERGTFSYTRHNRRIKDNQNMYLIIWKHRWRR